MEKIAITNNRTKVIQTGEGLRYESQETYGYNVIGTYTPDELKSLALQHDIFGAAYPIVNGYHIIDLSLLSINTTEEFISTNIYHPIIHNALPPIWIGDNGNLDSSKLEDVMMIEYLNTLDSFENDITVPKAYVKLWRTRDDTTKLLRKRKGSYLWYWLLVFVFLLVIIYVLYRIYR